MTKRAYGQYCGLARAVEVIAERWALLIIRDLLVGPRRFTDLHRGLPRIPTNILAARLKELEDAGVVRRRIVPRPAGSIVYELTEYGGELEGIVIGLGRWGARTLGDPRADEIITADSMIMALRTTFQPEAARGVRAAFELRMGEFVIHARIDDGTVEVGKGELPGADLVIEAGPALRELMAGEASPADAIENGGIRIQGDPALLTRFAQLFHIGPRPVTSPA